jgi:hypothetical protein
VRNDDPFLRAFPRRSLAIAAAVALGTSADAQAAGWAYASVTSASTAGVRGAVRCLVNVAAQRRHSQDMVRRS